MDVRSHLLTDRVDRRKGKGKLKKNKIIKHVTSTNIAHAASDYDDGDELDWNMMCNKLIWKEEKIYYNKRLCILTGAAFLCVSTYYFHFHVSLSFRTLMLVQSFSIYFLAASQIFISVCRLHCCLLNFFGTQADEDILFF